jgi:hypothetical protein
VLFSPVNCPAHVSKKDRQAFRYIALQIPPSAFELVGDDECDPSCMTLRPQAGPGQAELCRVLLAIRDEIDEPGPASRFTKRLLRYSC